MPQNGSWGVDMGIHRKIPHFVIDAQNMGIDTVLMTNPGERSSYLFRSVHMQLLAEAYDSYLRVREELNELLDSEEIGGDFHGLRNIETLMLILSPQFTDGSERSRARLRKMFARRELSIDELVQQLMKLPIEKET